MALDLQQADTGVKTVVTDRVGNRDLYSDWVPISSNQDLVSALEFADDSVILFNQVSSDHCMDWLEIGDQSTAHHLHDEDFRVRMIGNYLEHAPRDFKFDHVWVRSCIDWLAYDK